MGNGAGSTDLTNFFSNDDFWSTLRLDGSGLPLVSCPSGAISLLDLNRYQIRKDIKQVKMCFHRQSIFIFPDGSNPHNTGTQPATPGISNMHAVCGLHVASEDHRRPATTYYVDL